MKIPCFKRSLLRFVIPLLFLVLLVLILPFHQAQGILGIPSPTKFIITAQTVGLGFAMIFTGVAHALLIAVTSPYYISLPYTSGGIVDVGWPIMRDLANMGFIFALVFIGIGTALRLKEYEIKKALPNLIGMMLLVNFAPVICGAIVDATNIVMNFFLENLGGFDMVGNIISSYFQAVLSSYLSIAGYLTMHLDLMAKISALTAYTSLTGFFFLIYAVLFYMRHVIIWILVIISPLAFVANVLPGGMKKYYSLWWHHFLQWAIVGIPAAFFLYLSEQLMINFRSGNFAPLGQAKLPLYLDSFQEMFNTFLADGIVLAFMLVGFLLTLSSSAIGASAVISTSKKWAASAGKTAGKTAGKWAQAGADRGKRAVQTSGAFRGIADSMAKTDKKGVLGWAQRRIGVTMKKGTAGAAGFVSKGGKDTVDKLVAVDDYAGLAALMADITNDPGTRIYAGTEIAEKKKDTGISKLQKINKEVFLKTAKEAARKGNRPAVKTMAHDSFDIAMNKDIVSYLLDDPKAEEENLKFVQKDLQETITEIERKARSRERLNEYEKAVYGYVRRSFGNIASLGLNRSIDNIITARDKGYDAIASLYMLRETALGLDNDSIKKLSADSSDNPLFVGELVKTKSAGNLVTIKEKFGPQTFAKYEQARHDIGFEKLARINQQMVYASHTGVNQDHFEHVAGPKGETIGDHDTAKRFVGYVRHARPVPATLNPANPNLAPGGRGVNGSVIGSLPVMEGNTPTSFEIMPMGGGHFAVRKVTKTGPSMIWDPGKGKQNLEVGTNLAVDFSTPGPHPVKIGKRILNLVLDLAGTWRINA